jgi:hypothetical protein
MISPRGLLLAALAACLLIACRGDEPAEQASTQPIPELEFYGIGRPQNRSGIGDVDRAFARYEETDSALIATLRAQPWFQDGLTRDEALFAERSLTFVASYDGPRRAYVSDETIARKLYRYERLGLNQGELELLLIFEQGQNAEQQMTLLKLMVPALEGLVGVPFPEKVLTVVNGSFEVNDFSDGQYIRMARCCVLSPFVLAHELSHAYWSVGPSWLNEGMADIYAVLALERLNREQPSGWRPVPADIESHYRARKRQVDAGRFPDIILPRRFASDGLYEVADVFLLDIRREIGEDAFFAAARDIYLASDFGRVNLREKRIEDVFLAHTPSNKRDIVMSLFNRTIWGDDGQRYQQLKELEGP